MGIVLILAMLALFWVFLIRPKQRELKRHQSLVSSLDIGDEVMTGSGFYGVLTEVGDDTVRVELAPGLEVKVARRAVAAKVPAPSIEAEARTLTDPFEGPGDDLEADDAEIADIETADDGTVGHDDAGTHDAADAETGEAR